MELKFISEITTQYDSFTKVFRKIADYILKDYMQLPFLSIQEVANATSVSPASIHRFCIQLGYPGFSAFQREVQVFMQKNLAETESEEYRNWKQSGNSILQKQIDLNTTVLQEMLNEDLAINFDKSVEAIQKAKRVYIIGLRASYGIAALLYNLLHEYMDNVYLLTLGIDDIYDHIANINSDDLLFSIGFKAYTKYTVEIIKQFHKMGAVTITLTDKYTSPLAFNSDICLIPGNTTPSYGFVMAVTIVKALSVAINNIHDPEILKLYERKQDLLLENDILI
ncbi:hypothetical protein SDC9_81682 [bioreactor metagenome]|uniref:HTH-type transcriptional regulator YbbH n=1 Tax=bioreactor metagenome TaxID=1076179 RepID=A0A644Z2T3_9ZZZZ|nr:MurR/RpiR family transcriptional regulator [Candidatus Metalachnospira sp.]